MGIKQKTNTFRHRPIFSLRKKKRRILRRAIDWWGHRRLEQSGVTPFIDEFHATQPGHAIPPCYRDLWFLYKSVRTRRPKVVWEFGSGISTVVLTKALFDNGEGHLYSMDAEAQWAAVTTAAIPSRIAQFCTVMHSPADEVNYKGRLAFQHRVVPEVMPNFAYLDGPPLTPQRNIAIDLMLIEDELPADFFLVIDGRKENTSFLQQNFERRYVFKQREVSYQPVFELIA
ncbi:MAG: hypothetical protein ACR2GR_09035 [Rhodothermales bacterium]